MMGFDLKEISPLASQIRMSGNHRWSLSVWWAFLRVKNLLKIWSSGGYGLWLLSAVDRIDERGFFHNTLDAGFFISGGWRHGCRGHNSASYFSTSKNKNCGLNESYVMIFLLNLFFRLMQGR